MISYDVAAPTSQPSQQPSQPTRNPTQVPTQQPTYQPSLEPSSQPYTHPSSQPTRQPSAPPTSQPSQQPSSQPSTQPTGQPSYLPSEQPSILPSSQPSNQPSSQPTRQPFLQPTSQPSQQPSSAPTNKPSGRPTRQPSEQPSIQPSKHPSIQPSSQPSNQPSSQPTMQPTISPRCRPSQQPSSRPFIQPTGQPTHQPTKQPSTHPSMQPSVQPSTQPSKQPSSQPTIQPSTSPTWQPSQQPSSQPTIQPTGQPTAQPLQQPSPQPSRQPSHQPTRLPSHQLSSRPSYQPAVQPSSQPIEQPSMKPYSHPSCEPSTQPSTQPSRKPDPDCPQGTYYVLSPSRRFYECILCSPGYFSSAANVSACEPCPLNAFADSFGAAACTLCPAGYVSGNTGGTSQSVCVNPIINFSFGILSLCLSFMAVFVYIILGRVQRIAFERRRWLVEKCMILYGIVMEVVDDVRCVVRAVAAMEKSAKDKASNRSSSSSICKCTVGFLSPILKWISFAVFAALAAVAVVAETIFVATLHVLANGLLLYRAYRSQDSSLSSSLFLSRIDDFFSAMGQLLHLNSVAGMIAYPCSYVLNVLAFDLNTIQVPCPGSQAPINLLLDCFIAAVVLVLINSDSHLLWIARVQSAFFKWMPLLSSKRYVLNTLCSSLAAPVLNMIPFLVSMLPSPMKISQFLISYVSVSEFFSSNGHSRSSSNCDASAAIPIDTIEAYLTTILVVILIPPIIYLYAQVLFPSPMTIIAPGGGGEMMIPSSFVSETWKREADKWWRLVIAGSSVDWFLIKCLFNFGLSMLHMLQAFVVSVGRAHGQQRELEKFQEFFEDPLRGAALPDVAWLHALEYFEPHSDTEWQLEELKWQQQREQAPTYYSMIQVVQVDALKGGDAGSSSSPPSWRWYMWSKWFSLVGCWIVPLQLVYSSEARRMWMAVVAHYGMYFLMSAGCWTDSVVEKLMLIEKFRAFKALILTVEDDPEVVQTMENPLYSRSSIFLDKAATIVSGGGGDRAFSRDSSSGDLSAPRAAAEASAASRNGDAKDMFVQYLSAMTSCRAVMWQIVPGMTAFALLAVDTSTCPMLVFSKRLGRYLPPLIAVNAWTDARSQLETVLSASQQRPRSWQIMLVAASLWMRGSRLVQFSLNLFANAITWYVIFSSEGLFVPACAFLGVQVCVGLVKFGRILVDIHRIFFLSHHDGGGDGDGKEDDRYSAKKLDFQ